MDIPAAIPRIAVTCQSSLVEAVREASKVADFLRRVGVNTVGCAPLDDEVIRAEITAHSYDMVIALGGDGTMLRASHLCAPLGIPILGINLGRLGFLIQVQRDEWQNMLPLLLAGKYWLEERMMLRSEHWRDDQELGGWNVLNEVVVCRGQMVRPIQVKASVDGHEIASYIADGLIAATPTGSTAYALAAGGPIMPPELRNILIIPVAPHLSVDRAVILPEGACVIFTVGSRNEAVLSVDGHAPNQLQAGDEIRVAAGSHTASFIRFQDPGYFYRNLSLYMEQNPHAKEIT